MARSLNKVQLIGNLTRDPELRYTPNGNAVCTFGMATNRSWTTEAGEKREEVDFHRIVAWNKLGELCSQFLVKGRKVYVEGRLSTRNWTGQDGAQKSTTEVVIDDMILLDSRGNAPRAEGSESEEKAPEAPKARVAVTKKKEKTEEQASPEEEVMPDDIPF
jgi:single-strand DNA-binding protein